MLGCKGKGAPRMVRIKATKRLEIRENTFGNTSKTRYVVKSTRSKYSKNKSTYGYHSTISILIHAKF